MKMKLKMCCLLVMLVSLTAQAEVFKCKSAHGKTVYQSEPCSPSAKQSVIEVQEMTPEETENAKAKLRAWQEQQAVEEAEKIAAEKKQQEEFERQQMQDLQQRSLQQQQQQAIQAQQPHGINRRFGYMPN